MKKWIAVIKLVGLVLGETIFIAYPMASLTFWLAYAGDKMWGQHLMVNTADKWFTACSIFGLVCGAAVSFWTTRRTIKSLNGTGAPNQEVK